ncbi:helix-turn-helix domain-containing protein [Demequina sp. SO4-18]|uniref:helix-turn-helix domain-containing protein n=1 Tax=Demequina sp. SO4-18 TaxID=3401026 RepID=UPI003B5A834C
MTESLADRIFLEGEERTQSRSLANWLTRLTEPLPTERPIAAPEITPEFSRLVVRLLDDMARGRTVTVSALPEELTTTVAAEQLGVSRSTLMKWVRSGEISSHKVGAHTRVRTADVMALRRERLARQREELERLLELEDELNLE